MAKANFQRQRRAMCPEGELGIIGHSHQGLQWLLHCLVVCVHDIQVGVRLRVEVTHINCPLSATCWVGTLGLKLSKILWDGYGFPFYVCCGPEKSRPSPKTRQLVYGVRMLAEKCLIPQPTSFSLFSATHSTGRCRRCI